MCGGQSPSMELMHLCLCPTGAVHMFGPDAYMNKELID